MANKAHTLDISPSHALVAGELPSFISQQVSQARRFYFDLNPDLSGELSVVLGGWERVKPDYAIYRPTFPYFTIEFVADGEGHLTLAGEEHALRPGSVFTYGPGSPLAISASSPHLMLKYYVTFVGRDAAGLFDAVGLPACGFAQVAALHEVREIFDLLQKYGLSQTKYSQALCVSLLSTLLTKIAEQALPLPATDARSLATYQQLRQLLDREFLDLKNMKQAAKRCGVSVPYVCRLFHRFDHVTPYQYLMRHKMKYAADLLSHQEVLVKQVAQRLGFGDQYQFSRAFKRVFGLSPSQFQRHLVPREGEI